ncbi:MAG: ferritin-like domain-containing protein [Acidobacteriota bacterium]|nr:ferritin-like domain-containing protein [Acidobacteriota bacterium]
MEKFFQINDRESLIKYLNIALEHEWAVSFEYVIHAYSMPKGKYFYSDPVMDCPLDVRAQTIQIGIDEMYHALQIGLLLKQIGAEPSLRTDTIKRYPRIIDNLKRDKTTEEEVTELYQKATFNNIHDPKLQNMVLNIAADEIRHGRQFEAMINMMEKEGLAGDLIFQPDPETSGRKDLDILHELCQLENLMMHEYLYYVLLFSEHQDLGQRLFKNAINHMRHWDKLSGLLVKKGDVIRLENVQPAENGGEQSSVPMPYIYPGKTRLEALKSTLQGEKQLMEKYQRATDLIPEEEAKTQLKAQLALTREHLYTQQSLLGNVEKTRPD